MESDLHHVQDAAAGVTADFVEHRPMLYGLAYRLLGSAHDADDVLQEAYLRWAGGDRSTVDEPRRYLTRVVARLAVDALRARQRRREEYPGQWLPEPVSTDPSPFGEVDTSDLSLAVLHLMERLTPPQRAVYVLRTAFELPYDEIATVVDRAVDDCRQLYRRAELALRGDRPRFTPDPDVQRRLLADLVAAARQGDLSRLRRLLHDDVVLWSDGGGRVRTGRNPIVTPAKVARLFAGIYSRPAAFDAVELKLNGAPALLVTTSNGRGVLAIDVLDGMIVGVYLVKNPDKLRV